MAEKKQGQKGGLRKWLGLRSALDVSVHQDTSGKRNDSLNYRVKEDFLSEAEISFFHVLKNMVSERLAIFPKVSMADVFSSSGPVINEQKPKLNHKHVDFLLCDPNSLKPVLAIELEDASYPESDQSENDEIFEAVFSASLLPLVKVQAQDSYNISELARTFREAIENTPINEGGSP